MGEMPARTLALDSAPGTPSRRRRASVGVSFGGAAGVIYAGRILNLSTFEASNTSFPLLIPGQNT